MQLKWFFLQLTVTILVMKNFTLKKLNAVGLLFCFLILLACAGFNNDDDSSSSWDVVHPSQVTITAGTNITTTFVVNRLIAGNHPILMTISNPTLILATPTPTSILLSDSNTSQTVSLTIAVNGSKPVGNYPINIVLESQVDSETQSFTINVQVTSTPFSTGIVKLTDFVAGSDSSWASQFRIDNAQLPGILGSLSTPQPFDSSMRYWYRPDSRLSLGAGESATYEIIAALRNSATAVGVKSPIVSFTKAGVGTFSYSSSLTVPNQGNRNYLIGDIDLQMQPLLSQGNNTAQITFTLTPLAGLTGTYSVTVEGLNSTVTSATTPPSIVLDGTGNPVVFTIDFTRISDDTSHIGDAPYEFVIVGTNPSEPSTDVRQLYALDIFE